MNEESDGYEYPFVLRREWIAAPLAKVANRKTSPGPSGMTYAMLYHMPDIVLSFAGGHAKKLR